MGVDLDFAGGLRSEVAKTSLFGSRIHNMANGGGYLRLTRKAKGSEFNENSPTKLDASARAGSPTPEMFKRLWSLLKSRSSCIFSSSMRSLCSIRGYSKDSITVERMAQYNLPYPRR